MSAHAEYRINSTATVSPSAGSHTRRVTENGTEWLVAPAVAIREGVYSYRTSYGTTNEYLPGEEIADSAGEWGGKPLLLNHPTD